MTATPQEIIWTLGGLIAGLIISKLLDLFLRLANTVLDDLNQKIEDRNLKDLLWATAHWVPKDRKDLSEKIRKILEVKK